MLLGGRLGAVCGLSLPLRGILLYSVLSSSQEAFGWREESLCQIGKEASMMLISHSPFLVTLEHMAMTRGGGQERISSPALPLNGRMSLTQAQPSLP